MTTETTYKVDKKDLEAFMKDYSTDMVLAWLCGNRIDTETVCAILKISRGTLTNYIKAGRIAVMNEGEKAHEFDLSDVVRLFLVKTNKITTL